ncbi:hypothetical protein TRVL_02646 [Trypanosoma vivax]|nr:hypothetical protein TRVL_02646 [Trypanosoma vivax]
MCLESTRDREKAFLERRRKMKQEREGSRRPHLKFVDGLLCFCGWLCPLCGHGASAILYGLSEKGLREGEAAKMWTVAVTLKNAAGQGAAVEQRSKTGALRVEASDRALRDLLGGAELTEVRAISKNWSVSLVREMAEERTEEAIRKAQAIKDKANTITRLAPAGTGNIDDFAELMELYDTICTKCASCLTRATQDANPRPSR